MLLGTATLRIVNLASLIHFFKKSLKYMQGNIGLIHPML